MENKNNKTSIMWDEYHERIKKEGSYYQYTHGLSQYERRYPELMRALEGSFKKGVTIRDILDATRAKLWKMKEERAKGPRGWRTKRDFIKSRLELYRNLHHTYTNEEWETFVWSKAKKDWDMHLEDLDFMDEYTKATPFQRLQMYVYKKDIRCIPNVTAVPDELKSVFDLTTMPSDEDTYKQVRRLIMDVGKQHFVHVMQPILLQKYKQDGDGGALDMALNRMWDQLTPEHRKLFQEGIVPNQETILSILIHTLA
jgi:hypothetical protein